MIYEIIDHGCEHAQFWQGAGVAFTQFTEIATGSGSSAKEAGEDALEIFWQQVIKTDISTEDAARLEDEIAGLSPEEDAHYHCEHGEDNPLEEVCELAHRVSIRWRY
jgi:hypothetical protein